MVWHRRGFPDCIHRAPVKGINKIGQLFVVLGTAVVLPCGWGIILICVLLGDEKIMKFFFCDFVTRLGGEKNMK